MSEEGGEGWAALAAVFGVCPPIFVAMGWNGFFFEIPWPIALVMVTAGAAIAGLLQGKNLMAKLGYVVAYAVGAVGITLATSWYLEGRVNIFSYELLIPMLIGGLPGLGIGYGVSNVLE